MATPSRTGTAAEVNGSGGNGSTSVTVPGDCTGIICMWTMWDNNGSSQMGSLTLNSVGFTIIEQIAESADRNGSGIALLESPSTGAQTFAWVWSAGGARQEGGEIFLVFLKDINLGDAVRDTAIARGTLGSDVGITGLATTATDLVLVLAETYNDSAPVITSATTTFIDNSSLNSNVNDLGEVAPGASSINVAMTGESFSTLMAVSLKASAGGGAASLIYNPQPFQHMLVRAGGKHMPQTGDGKIMQMRRPPLVRPGLVRAADLDHLQRVA